MTTRAAGTRRRKPGGRSPPLWNGWTCAGAARFDAADIDRLFDKALPL